MAENAQAAKSSLDGELSSARYNEAWEKVWSKVLVKGPFLKSNEALSRNPARQLGPLNMLFLLGYILAGLHQSIGNGMDGVHIATHLAFFLVAKHLPHLVVVLLFPWLEVGNG